jgi:hypothetical protein
MTSRQRRIEEQRRKIESVRVEQRRKRMLFGAGAVVLAAALVALVVVFLPRPAAAQGRQVAIEGNRQHVPQGQEIVYRNRPPSSGDHYDTPAGYGFFQREIPTGNWIHDLEHGGIVVLFRPDLCDQGCQAQLQDTYSSAPTSSVFPGTRKMLISSYQDMDHAVAITAWGWLDEMDAPDKERLLAFYRAHVDRGPEQAL